MSDVQLDNIVLPDSVELIGLETAPDVTINELAVEDGSSVLQVTIYSGSVPLSLVFEDAGIITRGTLMAIKAKAALGLPVVLQHHLGTFLVLITSTAGMKPLNNFANPGDDDLRQGKIELKGVE